MKLKFYFRNEIYQCYRQGNPQLHFFLWHRDQIFAGLKPAEKSQKLLGYTSNFMKPNFKIKWNFEMITGTSFELHSQEGWENAYRFQDENQVENQVEVRTTSKIQPRALSHWTMTFALGIISEMKS